MIMSANKGTLVLLILWGLGTVTAFWYLEWQYLRPVARPAGAAIAKPEQLPPPPLATLATAHGEIRLSGPVPVTLLNFWNPSCPCSRYMEAHVSRLAETFGPRGVRLLTVVECGSSQEERVKALQTWKTRGYPAFTPIADPGSSIARAFGVWAAPAAVILNRKGQVVYVGAYNTARYCDNEQTAWAQLALKATLDNRLPPYPKSPFYGCQVLATQNNLIFCVCQVSP